MQYRRLGRSGLKLSEIALGSWMTYGTSVEMEQARACVRRAYELGVNHFDCAVVYGSHPHEAEELLGAILREFPRHTYTVTSKVFWEAGPSQYDRGLSRKHIADQVELSLQALGLDYIDIYYCHWYDPDTDLEETLYALDDLVARGKILYYGFSQWSAAQFANAAAMVERRGLRRPVVSQPVYNMLNRYIEPEILPLCEREGIGQVVFSPLAQGVLTGKYRPGQAPGAGTRAAGPGASRGLRAMVADADLLAKVQQLQAVAAESGLSLPQMALAWVLRRPEVTSALIGASRPEQVEENVKAAGIRLTNETMEAIEQIIG